MTGRCDPSSSPFCGSGLDRIDIVLIHDVDVWTHGPEGVETRFREAMEGAYRALDRLRQEGIIRAIGVGLNESEMCVRFAEAGDFDCALLAGRYSLLQQDALDRFLPLAARKGIGVILGGVFNSGILATGARPDARFNYAPAPPEIMERVARSSGSARRMECRSRSRPCNLLSRARRSRP
jgi:D-threo-aldose 1-dehydrogenase